MVHYEILVGLKKNIFIRSRGLILKHSFLKQFNFNAQTCSNICTNIPKKKLALELYFQDVNLNNIRSYYTSVCNKRQMLIKDEQKVKTSEISESREDFFEDESNYTVRHKYRKKRINNLSIDKVSDDVLKWLVSETEKPPIPDLLKQFPQPKLLLHNVYDDVATQKKIENCLQLETKFVKVSKGDKWLCSYHVKWPEDKRFTSLSSTKVSASSSAALKCLLWLHLIKKLKNKRPVIYDDVEMKSIIKSSEELKVQTSVLETVNKFLYLYEDPIKNFILENENNKEAFSSTNVEKYDHPISQKKTNINRNEYLKKKLESRQKVSVLDLPIFEYRSQILKELENNQVLLIKGDTGCGKTTQVPQFIIDDMIKKNLGSECSMIVTQPRRISAISLAERITYERNEKIGDVIGYQVRLQQVLPRQFGAVLFCTTGILLKKLQNNPKLEGLSHVIVDEAHERTIDIDVLLVLLKRAMKQNSKLKVIVMSATVNADLFQDYFKCNVVDIPGRLFSVQMNFLDEINNLKLPFSKMTEAQESNEVIVNYSQISNLIRWISNNKPPGAILCFLPGWSDILNVQSNLEENPVPNQLIIPLHSKIEYVNQRTIFDKTPDGVRKIILATDIAETGITVPDVVYVVDSACHKTPGWDENTGLSSINTALISQANINQRKGRAGRVKSGESYHFLTRKRYKELHAYPVPEVSCISLEKTVLDCKIYSNERAETFLGSMPQPPRVTSIVKAVYDLQNLGALDEDENLTPLGKKLIYFSHDPKLSKAVVYSSIFECLDKMLTIVTALSTKMEIFYGALYNVKGIREMKSKFDPLSDHMSIAQIYNKWQDSYVNDPLMIWKFCKNHSLQADKMNLLYKMRQLNLQCAIEANLVNESDFYLDDGQIKYNRNNDINELTLGVLLASVNKLMLKRNFKLRKGRLIKSSTSLVTEENYTAEIAQESVNYKRTSWPSPYLTYFDKMHNVRSRINKIRECSIVSPITVLLFTQGDVKISEKSNDSNGESVLLKIENNQNVRLVCDKDAAITLLRFRDTMWSIINYYIETQQNESPMDSYKTEMLKVLIEILNSEKYLK